MKSKKLLLTVLFAGLFAVTSFSQSNPAAFNLASGNYTFAAWDAASPAGTYPPNMVFHVSNALEAVSFNPIGNYVCPYNLVARARVMGKNAEGFSWQNTATSLNLSCTGSPEPATVDRKFMGAAVLALSTLNQESVLVSWTGRMFSNYTYTVGTQTRFYGIKLQYRTDSTSSFQDVPDALVFNSNINETTYRTQGSSQEFPLVSLPPNCNNKPYIQLRWLYFQTLSGSGERPQIGVDEISVSSVSSNLSATITAVGPTEVCQGNTVVLSSTAAESYLWSNGETTQSIEVANAGSYFVTVSNSTGTTATSNSIQVTILPAPNAAISFSGASAICDGASVTLNSNLAASYLWSNAATTASIVVATPGDYSVTVTYTNGCTSTSSPVTISNSTSPAVPQITYNGAFDLQSTVAVAYQWLLAGAEITGANSQFYTPTENGIYAVIVSNENGCTSVSLPYEWLITSLNKNSNSNLAIFPNPSQNHITVVWESEKIKYVHIYDLLGNLVQIEYENFNKINVSNLSNGNYFVRIFNAKGVSENRFLNKQ
jgi:hypothetical protein